MATKIYEIETIGTVSVSKRRSSRQITLSLSPQGKVRVSIPSWAPYQAGVNFAQSKAAWIVSKQPLELRFLANQRFTSGHELYFAMSPNISKPTHKIQGNKITVTYPDNLNINHPDVQKKAQQAVIKALRLQAEVKLPPRIDSLSRQFNLPYSELKIKQLSRRWGSCDKDHKIVLNLFLTQLPSELIDYVICHELAHTKELNHGPAFWDVLNQISANAQHLKREIKNYNPRILTREG